MQFNQFQLLQDVMENLSKKLSIQMDIKDIQEERIKKLQDLLRSHKGKHNLSFVIYDGEEQIKLHMPSRKQKVTISKELLDELDEQSVFYKLN